MEYPTNQANTLTNSCCITDTVVVERDTFIATGTAIILISIVGLMGNALVIVAVAASTKLQTATNVFVVNLSIADLSTCLVIPFDSVIMFSSYETPVPEWFCGIVAGVSFTSAACSIYTLTVIAINRFLLIKGYKIYRTLFSPPSIVAWIICAWVAAFSATTLPPLLGVGHLGINQKYRLCGGVSSDEGVHNQEIIQTVACFPLPTFIIIFCYTGIYFHIRRHFKKMTRSMSVVPGGSPNVIGNSMTRSSVSAGQPQDSNSRRVSASDTLTRSDQFSTELGVDAIQLQDTNSPRLASSSGTLTRNNKSSATLPVHSRLASSSGTLTRNDKSSATSPVDSGQRRNRKNRLASIGGTSIKRRQREQLSISKNLFYTTIAFSVCVTPYSLFLVLPDITGTQLPRPLMHCSGVILLMGSAINPILYGFKHPHFKEVFRMLLTRRWSQVPNPSNIFKTLLEKCSNCRGN